MELKKKEDTARPKVRRGAYLETKDLADLFVMAVGLTAAPLLLCTLSTLFLALLATTVLLAFMIVSIIFWYFLARSVTMLAGLPGSMS